MSAETHAVLQEAMVTHIQSELEAQGVEPPVVVTHWTLVIATIDANGMPGTMREDSQYESAPAWVVGGLLNDAMQRLYGERGEE